MAPYGSRPATRSPSPAANRTPGSTRMQNTPPRSCGSSCRHPGADPNEGGLPVHLELVDPGGTAAALLGGDDVEPDVPRGRGHGVGAHAGRVAAGLDDRGPRAAVAGHLDVVVAGVPGRALATGAGLTE